MVFQRRICVVAENLSVYNMYNVYTYLKYKMNLYWTFLHCTIGN